MRDNDPFPDLGKKDDNTYKLLEFFYNLKGNDIKYRIENRSVSVFVKTQEMIDKIIELFPQECVEVYKPANTSVAEYLSENNKTIIKPKLTHGCRYKVYLKNPKKPVEATVKQGLANLIHNNRDKFANIKTSFMNFLLDPNKKWLSHSYIYVKDSNTLLMMQLISQDLIKETMTIITEAEIEQKEKANV
jgi:hypothetical protein